MARTAFVTGASGFVGGKLTERLLSDGWSVRALARSEGSAEQVRALGAEPVRGDLDDVPALIEGARGADAVFHNAAKVEEWGPLEEFEHINVEGTRNLVEAARAGGAGRLVHTGTESAVLDGNALVNADESAPLRFDKRFPYGATKARAEQVVLGAANGLETVVVRPRLVWGKGDTTILPALVEATRSGRFVWIDGGRHLTSTAHIQNVVDGLLDGLERGRSGEAYFITDGEPVVFRDFVTALLETQGIEPPTRSMPRSVANVVTAAGEGAARLLRRSSPPPLTRTALWLASRECTLDDSKARRELGYQPRVTVEQGLAELRQG